MKTSTFYHLFHNQYDKSNFVEDVNSKNNINDVIKQLLHDLCGKRLCKDENVNQDDLDRIRQCMINLPTSSQINSNGFHNLRLLDLTEASPTIIKNCIQGRHLTNGKWL
jgi:chorismate mutase